VAKAKRVALEEGLDARATAELIRAAPEVFEEKAPDPEQRLRDLAITARAFGHRLPASRSCPGAGPFGHLRGDRVLYTDDGRARRASL
jgi:hypothetical protein